MWPRVLVCVCEPLSPRKPADHFVWHCALAHRRACHVDDDVASPHYLGHRAVGLLAAAGSSGTRRCDTEVTVVHGLSGEARPKATSLCAALAQRVVALERPLLGWLSTSFSCTWNTNMVAFRSSAFRVRSREGFGGRARPAARLPGCGAVPASRVGGTRQSWTRLVGAEPRRGASGCRPVSRQTAALSCLRGRARGASASMAGVRNRTRYTTHHASPERRTTSQTPPRNACGRLTVYSTRARRIWWLHAAFEYPGAPLGCLGLP